MKRKIIFISVCSIILLGIAITAYFFFADIESTPTKEIMQHCHVEQQKQQNRTVFTITPKEGIKNDTVILYLHGGAYVAEMSQKHWEFIQAIVQDTGATVILPDYPLTPKYHYQDVFHMIVPVYTQLLQKTDSQNIIIIGDSAGGGMALALCEYLQEKQIMEPRKAILISPWLEVGLENPAIDSVQKDDKKLSKESLKIAGLAYAGGNQKNLKNYLVSPLYGNVENLNNIVIYTGTYDILNPDVKELVKKNANIVVKEYEGKSHIWLIDEREEAKEEYQDFIQQIIE